MREDDSKKNIDLSLRKAGKISQSRWNISSVSNVSFPRCSRLDLNIMLTRKMSANLQHLCETRKKFPSAYVDLFCDF